MNSIGERIKLIRTLNNLSMEQFAEIIGSNKSNISSYEKNKYEPSSKYLVTISERFNVTTDWILTGIGKGPQEPGNNEENYSPAETHNQSSIGERLILLREKRGLNRAQVMKDLSIHNLGRYEENERSPSLENVMSLANYYGVSIDWIATGQDKAFSIENLSANSTGELESLENVLHYLHSAVTEKQISREDLFRLVHEINECIAVAYDPNAEYTETLNKYELSLIRSYRKLPDRDQGAVDQFVRTLLADISADCQQTEKKNSAELSASQTGRDETAATRMDAEGRGIA